MISDWGEVVTRYPYGNVRMDHLLSKENMSFSILLVMFLCGLINNAFVAQLVRAHADKREVWFKSTQTHHMGI